MSQTTLLLTLLIHRHFREKYYQKHDLFVEKQKRWVEKLWQEPFDKLPTEKQISYLDQWFWPPWRFNDIVGYAEMEMETEWTVIGHLYLPEGRHSRVVKKPLLLNYACASAHFEQDNLSSLRKAIIDVARQLKELVSERRWKLEFHEEMVMHTDFLELSKRQTKKSGE